MLISSPKLYKILVIDDELPILRLLNKLLARIGFLVDVAENGKAGINKINQNSYDLILTDIKMPEVSGDEVLEYVKSKNKSIPVIGMSGTPWLFEQHSFDAILNKPYNNQELVEVVNRFLKGKLGIDPHDGSF
ncbi:MAG: response regulator [Desulfamplus sp.]|nr:response regulator [Desulfamplus sp.]